MVHWEDHEIYAAAAGGFLIAIATSMNLYYYGRISGISGMYNHLIKHPNKHGSHWKFTFLLGMITIPYITYLINGDNYEFDHKVFKLFATQNDTTHGPGSLSSWGWILGGFLVGFGARMANGCTSGHGVCGIPRLNKRSILAIILFMVFGMLYATLDQQ